MHVVLQILLPEYYVLLQTKFLPASTILQAYVHLAEQGKLIHLCLLTLIVEVQRIEVAAHLMTIQQHGDSSMASCSVPFPAVMPSSLQRLNQLLYFFLCHDYVTVFVLMICQRAVGFTWGPGWKRLPCVKICMHRHQHQTSQQTVECWLSMCAMFSVVVGLHVAVLGQSGSGCCGTLIATDRQTNRKTGPFIQGFHGISARCSSLMATACANADCKY